MTTSHHVQITYNKRGETARRVLHRYFDGTRVDAISAMQRYVERLISLGNVVASAEVLNG